MKLKVKARMNPKNPSVDSMKFLSKDGKTELNYDEWFEEFGKEVKKEFEKGKRNENTRTNN
jgi:hypothetical protein